jgi:hypothetical protein
MLKTVILIAVHKLQRVLPKMERAGCLGGGATVSATASNQRFLQACFLPPVVVGHRRQHTQLRRFVELVELVELVEGLFYPPSAMQGS